jgi:hypothetical protein
MSWDDNKERCQKIYFGKPLGFKPTRREVGEFIMNEMGMIYDEGPAWSDGVPKLVEMGMRYSRNRFDGESLETYDEVRHERDKLLRKNEELREQLSDRRKQIRSKRAVDRLEQIEATLLKVLCEEADRGDGTPGFVEVPTVVEESELDYSTVVNYIRKLTRDEFGGYVEYRKGEEKARATRKSAFEEYCRRAKLDKSQFASS